jgi:hypothetical protein
MNVIDDLEQVTQELHGGTATHVDSVPIHEQFEGKTVWKGVVEVFDLDNHPKAHRAYDCWQGRRIASAQFFASTSPHALTSWRNMKSGTPLSPQEVSDFIAKFSTSSANTLVVFFDKSTAIGFTTVGRLKLFDGGIFSVQDEGDVGITESPSFNASISGLVRFPCEFADPRSFKDDPKASAFFSTEVRFDFGIVFALPNGILSIAQLEE